MLGLCSQTETVVCQVMTVITCRRDNFNALLSRAAALTVQMVQNMDVQWLTGI